MLGLCFGISMIFPKNNKWLKFETKCIALNLAWMLECLIG